ncbi:MAG: diacylglycerol kinase family protein, partial [Phycisphaerales bacterium]
MLTVDDPVRSSATIKHHPSPTADPAMPPDPSFVQRTWFRKFRDAFRGVVIGVRGQSSFQVHLAVGIMVVVAGVALAIDLTEWCILTICIVGVLTAEMLNSSLESMAKAIT